MRKKKSTALLLALLMVASVFFNATSVFAEGKQDAPVKNQSVEKVEKVKTEDKKDDPEKVKAAEDELEISEEEVPDAVGEPAAEKTFTVTKDSGGTTTTVGEYDKFYDAVKAMGVNDPNSFFTIYVNKSATVPKEEMGDYYRSNNKFRLTSGKGGPYTLKREGVWGILGIGDKSELTVDNITLDGNKTCQCFFISNNGKVTLGNGATIQNFVDSPKEDGPAIHMTGGTLNIEDGAVIQDNISNTSGGAIQAYNGTTVNISGGTFKNNTSNTSGGGFLAAYGTLKITGGTFENNKAKNTGGAIIIGKNHPATISNATFKENKASTGGAIYSSQEMNASNLIFESNEANWGGAIFDKGNSSIKNTNFNKNHAQYYGGAIYTTNGTTVADSYFLENQTLQGGGIYIDKNATNPTIVSNTSFEKNSVVYGGAGIFVDKNSKLEVTNSTFAKNNAARGAGISSAATGNVDKEKTNIKVDPSTFTENLSYMGAGIFTAFPTEINKCTFTGNKAALQPGDDKKNPHDSGVGGAVEVMDNKTIIKASTFEENYAYGSGGAIGISGVARDKTGKITGIKANIKVEIEGGTIFKNNIAQEGQGGAIFTIPYLYDLGGQNSDVKPEDLKKEAYKNLTTAADTVFKDNVALSGYVDPPEKYADYANLAFARNSFTDVLPGKDVAKSLLNNYDVNYKNKKLTAFFDPNEGEFKDGENPKDIRVVKGEKDKEITLLDAPKREGYKFTGWKCSMNIPEESLKGLPKEILDQLNEGKIFKAGDKFKLDADYIFVAQWKEDPKKPDKPTPGGGFYFVPTDTPLLNRKDHAQYMIGYPDQNFKPDNHMSRQEVTVMFSRLLNERPQKGAIYSRDYKDIPDDLWSVTAISYMSKLGMVKGYPDGNFMPRADITRAEFAAMATRFADISSGSKTFTDVAKDHWAYDVIQKAAAAGWISGYPDGSFKPDQPITRAEVVAITNRMLNRFADEAFVDAHQGKIIRFKDMNKGMWSYYPVVEATNGHGYERKANGKDETWLEVNGTSFVYDK